MNYWIPYKIILALHVDKCTHIGTINTLLSRHRIINKQEIPHVFTQIYPKINYRMSISNLGRTPTCMWACYIQQVFDSPETKSCSCCTSTCKHVNALTWRKLKISIAWLGSGIYSCVQCMLREHILLMCVSSHIVV